MKINYKNVIIPVALIVLFFSLVSMLNAANVSVEVQENIDSLVMTNKCVDCNLTGADLNRLNLSGADLRGADLSNATFYLADLSDANLSGAILTGTQFGGADLAGADLRNADLRGVKLAGAYLVGCKLDGSFTEVTASDDSSEVESVEKAYIPDDSVPKKVPEKKQVNIAERRDFGPVPPQLNSSAGPAAEAMVKSPVDSSAPAIKTVSPPENIIIKNEIIETPGENKEQDLIQDQSLTQQQAETQNNSIKTESGESALAEITEADILVSDSKDQAAVIFEEKEVDLPEKEEMTPGSTKDETESASPEVSETEASVDEMKQPVTSDAIAETKNEVSQELLNLEKQLKKYKKCYNCNLAGSDFSGKNFDGFDLEGSDFSGANLEKADFEDANLKGVSFKNANLKNAKFNRADLYKADFVGADLTGAEFKKALIDETNFHDAIGYDSLILSQPQ